MGWCAFAGVCAGLVQRHRDQSLRTCPHPAGSRRSFLRVAVAVGRHVDDQIDMEIRSAVQNRLGVLRDLHVQLFYRGGVLVVDRVKIAGSQAPAASHALVVINARLLLRERDRAVCAVLCTDSAPHACVAVHGRFAAVVLLHLAGPAAAAHADILEGSSESGRLMALEVVQADEDVPRPSPRGRSWPPSPARRPPPARPRRPSPSGRPL